LGRVNPTGQSARVSGVCRFATVIKGGSVSHSLTGFTSFASPEIPVFAEKSIDFAEVYLYD
jgi:hypothetical protein